MEPGKCWNWRGAGTQDGYGQLSIRHRPVLAHRLAYAIHNGTDPGHLSVLHQCDNPRCCNPEHLFLGTQRKNMRDMQAKRRNPVGSHHGRAKLSEAAVQRIRASLASGVKAQELADTYGVTQAMISHIKTGRAWKWLPPQ